MSYSRFKVNFDYSEKITNNYSQASQDIFVLSCLNGKKNGTFLDLGCGHPIDINNTYLLESEFDWYGLNIDNNFGLVSLYENTRKTPAMALDATAIDFDMVLSNFNSNHVDYLSLDLEPASVTMSALKNIPFDKIEFSVITFEHDSYRFGNQYRDESREIFSKHGYKLLVSDVSNNFNIYEDWYFNPKYVKYDHVKIFECDGKEWKEILFN